MPIKHELQNLIQGKGRDRETNSIQEITGFLRASKEAGAGNEGKEYTKRQEEERLIDFVSKNNLWYRNQIIEHNKIGAGAEQCVYYDELRGIVIKTNDSIFFEYWLDYFYNLIVHNYFFEDTAYSLLGFKVLKDTLYAVVEQPHVVKTEDINLENVRTFLAENGFENTRRNDYYNKELGIILEDLHDENVICSNQNLFFIDTVFYLTKRFYESDEAK
jgi:hypothetical protein